MPTSATIVAFEVMISCNL